MGFPGMAGLDGSLYYLGHMDPWFSNHTRQYDSLDSITPPEVFLSSQETLAEDNLGLLKPGMRVLLAARGRGEEGH